jgi:hypothetical protein
VNYAKPSSARGTKTPRTRATLVAALICAFAPCTSALAGHSPRARASTHSLSRGYTWSKGYTSSRSIGCVPGSCTSQGLAQPMSIDPWMNQE